MLLNPELVMQEEQKRSMAQQVSTHEQVRNIACHFCVSACDTAIAAAAALLLDTRAALLCLRLDNQLVQPGQTQ